MRIKIYEFRLFYLNLSTTGLLSCTSLSINYIPMIFSLAFFQLFLCRNRICSQTERFLTRNSTIAFTPHRQISRRFWPKCSKFAVKCESNSRFSQYGQSLGLFWKRSCALRKIFHFKMATAVQVAGECVSNGISLLEKFFSALIMSFFQHQIWKIRLLEKVRDSDGNNKKCFSEEERFYLSGNFFFKKG